MGRGRGHTPQLPLVLPLPDSCTLPRLPGLPKVSRVPSVCHVAQPLPSTWAPPPITHSPLLHSFPDPVPSVPPSLVSLA